MDKNEIHYTEQCQCHLWMGRHSWEVAFQHMCVCVCVYWDCWNSIRQMGLFRVLSLLPKKGPICSCILPTIDINIQHAYIFLFNSACFYFYSLPFSSVGYGCWWKSKCTLTPFTSQKMNVSVRPRCFRGEKHEPLVRGCYCRDYSVRLDRESRSGRRQPRPLGGENRDDPPVPLLSEGFLCDF